MTYICKWFVLQGDRHEVFDNKEDARARGWELGNGAETSIYMGCPNAMSESYPNECKKYRMFVFRRDQNSKHQKQSKTSDEQA